MSQVRPLETPPPASPGAGNVRDAQPVAAGVARIRSYLRRRFPLHVNGLAAVLLFYGAYLLLARTAFGHRGTPGMALSTVAGAVTVCAAMLLMRILDDLHDLETDRQFHPDRYAAGGALRPRELAMLALVVLALAVALNFHAGWAAVALAAFMAVLAFDSFLLPRVAHERYLLQWLASEPLYALLIAYVYGLFVDATGVRVDGWSLAAIVGALWFPIEAWELARKIREPKDEDGYPTYSKLLGPRGAAGATGLLVAGSLAADLYLWWRDHLSAAFLVLAVALAATIAIPLIKFLTTLRLPKGGLKRSAEAYGLAIQVVIVLELLIFGT